MGRRCQEAHWEGKGEEASRGRVNERVPPAGTWGSVPLGSSRSHHGTHLRGGATCEGSWGISTPTPIYLWLSAAGLGGGAYFPQVPAVKSLSEKGQRR